MILKVHESACSHQYNWLNPLSLIYNRLYKMIVKSFTIVSQSDTIVKQTATLPSTKKEKDFRIECIWRTSSHSQGSDLFFDLLNKTNPTYERLFSCVLIIVLRDYFYMLNTSATK